MRRYSGKHRSGRVAGACRALPLARDPWAPWPLFPGWPAERYTVATEGGVR